MRRLSDPGTADHAHESIGSSFHSPLSSIHRQLKATGRGRHVGGFSYYHKSPITRVVGLADWLDSFANRFDWLRRELDSNQHTLLIKTII